MVILVSAVLILLVFFSVVGIAHTECRHTKQNRNVKLDICKECKELLNETISPAFKDLKNFSRCLEVLDISLTYLLWLFF